MRGSADMLHRLESAREEWTEREEGRREGGEGESHPQHSPQRVRSLAISLVPR